MRDITNFVAAQSPSEAAAESLDHILGLINDRPLISYAEMEERMAYARQIRAEHLGSAGRSILRTVTARLDTRSRARPAPLLQRLPS